MLHEIALERSETAEWQLVSIHPLKSMEDIVNNISITLSTLSIELPATVATTSGESLTALNTFGEDDSMWVVVVGDDKRLEFAKAMNW